MDPSYITTPRTRRKCADLRSGVKMFSRISQLINEESTDNDREITHERGTITDIQLSQSCEDLKFGWSMNDDNNSCQSKPLSNPSTPKYNVRFPSIYHTPNNRRSLTPTSRRSMSPATIRPSKLVTSGKRHFQFDDKFDVSTNSPPMKKTFVESHGSPLISMRQTSSPLAICSSPDSGILMQSGDSKDSPKYVESTLVINSATTSDVEIDGCTNDNMPSPVTTSHVVDNTNISMD